MLMWRRAFALGSCPQLSMNVSSILSSSGPARAPSLEECSSNTRCLLGARPVALTHAVACEYERTQVLD